MVSLSFTLKLYDNLKILSFLDFNGKIIYNKVDESIYYYKHNLTSIMTTGQCYLQFYSSLGVLFHETIYEVYEEGFMEYTKYFMLHSFPSTPVFISLYIKEAYKQAAIVVLISGLTDFRWFCSKNISHKTEFGN